MEKERVRERKITEKQKEVLILFMEDNKSFSEGKFVGPQGSLSNAKR